jgi:hypothetical protein
MLENLVLDALDVASVTLWVCRLPYALLSVAVPAVSSSATRYDALRCVEPPLVTVQSTA